MYFVVCVFFCYVINGYSADNTETTTEYPFRNISLPWEERANDIVKRLSLEELVHQVSFGGGHCGKPTPAIPRLRIGPYNFDTECLHGVMNNRATAFTQAVGLAATFSSDILHQVAEVIAIEARAIFNNASLHGDFGVMKSVSCLAPFISIMRHPLWGRVQEVYGEDPYLSGELASGYVRGLQGNHSRYVRANAGCKVVAAHSGPENIPSSRFSFDSIVSERDMRLTYLPNQRACIEAGSYNLMCSYNSINGIPACANKALLTEILRGEFGFKGYYISDEGAIERIYISHKYVNSSIEAAVAALRAGVNLDLTLSCKPYYLLLGEAVTRGLIHENLLAERVQPLFYTRLRLGEFDPPEMNPYTKINMSVVLSSDHRGMAVDVATKSFVLLKNNFLPIKSKRDTLAIVGPMSNNLEQLYGNYNPIPVRQYAKTPYQGLKSLANTTLLANGCEDNRCRVYNQTEVKNAATVSDMVIVCLGTGSQIEGEGQDRSDLLLPGKQLQLLQDVVRYASGRPVVLLLFTGGPVDISWAKFTAGVSAILQCFFPAQATGEALYRVLATSRDSVVSPSSRLPYTWPASLDQVPPMTNYSMEGRTYRYFKGIPLYPFGYGLSYSTFHYSSLTVPGTVSHGDNLTVTVVLSNRGPYDADEVVQVYISWVDCPVAMPQRQMVAVHRQHLHVHERREVCLTVLAQQLMVWHDTQGFVYHNGDVDIWAGGQQPDQETTAPSNVLHARSRMIPGPQ